MLLLSLLASPAHAGAVGVGLALGAPTGVTASVYLTDRTNLDFLVGEGWAEEWGDRFLISADYDAHLVDLASGDAARLDFYLGGGANMWFERDHDVDVGLEMPIGLAVFFRKAPVELYFELLPGFVLTDYEWFDVGGSVGARYYFGAN